MGCGLVGTAWRSWHSRRGWARECFIEEFTHSQGEKSWSTTLLEPRLCLDPSVDKLSYNSLTLRRLLSYIYGAPILDVSRSHTTTQHSR